MVRCDNDNGVKILPCKKLAIIVVFGTASVGSFQVFGGVIIIYMFSGLFASYAVDIADTKDLKIGVSDESVQMTVAHDTLADKPYCNTIARCGAVICTYC